MSPLKPRQLQHSSNLTLNCFSPLTQPRTNLIKNQPTTKQNRTLSKPPTFWLRTVLVQWKFRQGPERGQRAGRSAGGGIAETKCCSQMLGWPKAGTASCSPQADLWSQEKNSPWCVCSSRHNTTANLGCCSKHGNCYYLITIKRKMIFHSTFKDFHVNNWNLNHISLSLGVCVADGELQVMEDRKSWHCPPVGFLPFAFSILVYPVETHFKKCWVWKYNKQ